MGLGWLVSGAYHPAYRKMQPAEAAQIVGTPTNLPLALVIASDAHFAAHARADAHDVAITLADGMTELDYERVAWNNGTGALEIWLKDPAPESGDRYYIYYGDADQAADRQDAAGVWSNDFITVHHMTGAAYTDLDDSVGGLDIDGETGDPAYQQTGQIGEAVTFDGNDGLTISDPAGGELDFALTDSFTLAAWVKTTDAGNQSLLTKAAAGNYYYFRLQNGAAAGKPRFYIWDGSNIPIKDAGTAVHDGDWHRVVAVRDVGSDVLRIYIDGSEDGAGVADSTTGGLESTDDFALATVGSSPGDFGLVGSEDEVFISSVARGDDWNATAFNNQDSPAPGGTFWSALGSEEKESRYPAVVFQCPAIV